jgi:hypothetical protein
MSTDTLPHIFSLSPEERRKVYDEAAERAMEAVREMAAEHKARKIDPRSIHDYRAWHTMRMVCILVVKHRDKAASVEVLRDGGAFPHIYLPTSKMIRQPECTEDFVLAVIPKWLAQKAELQGVAPELCAERPWTDEQRAAWKSLSVARLNINTKIYFAKKRPHSLISRGDAA